MRGKHFLLFWAVVTQVYTFVKSQLTGYLRTVHFLSVKKSYLNKPILNNPKVKQWNKAIHMFNCKEELELPECNWIKQHNMIRVTFFWWNSEEASSGWWKKEKGINDFMQLRSPGMELASGFKGDLWPGLPSSLLPFCFLSVGSFMSPSHSRMAKEDQGSSKRPGLALIRPPPITAAGRWRKT